MNFQVYYTRWKSITRSNWQHLFQLLRIACSRGIKLTPGPGLDQDFRGCSQAGPIGLIAAGAGPAAVAGSIFRWWWEESGASGTSWVPARPSLSSSTNAHVYQGSGILNSAAGHAPLALPPISSNLLDYWWAGWNGSTAGSGLWVICLTPLAIVWCLVFQEVGGVGQNSLR